MGKVFLFTGTFHFCNTIDNQDGAPNPLRRKDIPAKLIEKSLLKTRRVLLLINFFFIIFGLCLRFDKFKKKTFGIYKSSKSYTV